VTMDAAVNNDFDDSVAGHDSGRVLDLNRGWTGLEHWTCLAVQVQRHAHVR